MPASTSPRCRARALRKEVDTSARTANVAIKKIPDAIITSMRVKAPVERQRASRLKNEKPLLVFILFHTTPCEGPKHRPNSSTAEDRQWMAEKVLCARRATEADGRMSMLNLGEPMVASNGLFANKTAIIGGLDGFGTVDHFQLHLNSRRPCCCRLASGAAQLRLLEKSLKPVGSRSSH